MGNKAHSGLLKLRLRRDRAGLPKFRSLYQVSIANLNQLLLGAQLQGVLCKCKSLYPGTTMTKFLVQYILVARHRCKLLYLADVMHRRLVVRSLLAAALFEPASPFKLLAHKQLYPVSVKPSQAGTAGLLSAIQQHELQKHVARHSHRSHYPAPAKPNRADILRLPGQLNQTARIASPNPTPSWQLDMPKDPRAVKPASYVQANRTILTVAQTTSAARCSVPFVAVVIQTATATRIPC
jgi:hypothetical protein